MSGEKLETEMKLEQLRSAFIKKVTNMSLLDNECLLFSWCLGIYFKSFMQNNWLFFNQKINIHQILCDEWYFYEDYTKELLDNLNDKELIIYCDLRRDIFYLNIEKETVTQYLSDVRKIKPFGQTT